jgi:hypothetical protein
MRRNSRRAYDAQGREIEPGNLADMRQNGVRSVEAWADAALKLAKHKRKRESNAPCPRAPPKRER